MRRVLVTGASGMLASELCLRAPSGVTAVGTDLRPGTNVPAAGFDLADPARIAQLFAEHGPFDGVIHAAAFTAVDLAEAQADAAQRANEGSARELAKACAAASIPLVLVSTGAQDWLESSGQATRVEGGYRVTAQKRFASGSPVGDLVLTSAPYDDPEAGAQVLEFAVPV